MTDFPNQRRTEQHGKIGSSRRLTPRERPYGTQVACPASPRPRPRAGIHPKSQLQKEGGELSSHLPRGGGGATGSCPVFVLAAVHEIETPLLGRLRSGEWLCAGGVG
jgi:hypothetical protein